MEPFTCAADALIIQSMTEVPWERIEPLLAHCLDLSSDEREAYLSTACGEETAQRVRQLLAAEVSPKGQRFLDPIGGVSGSGQKGSPRTTESEAARSLAGTLLGPWRLVEPIGEGGMGVVWLGERADGAFEKRVAVKLLKLGLHLPEFERRFDNEVRVLAALEHPGIVRLLDGGRSAQDVPYLVLDYVAGEPIDTWCDARRLGFRERIELFLQVCDAVQCAHERGVLHRDLKPDNLLVDGAGRTRLLDFGIAKVASEIDGGGTIGATRTGQRLYSPRYGSPEQVRGEETSASSDVYSLGVMLYELLVGCPPVRVNGVSQFELERAACETDAMLPSRAAEWPFEASQEDDEERSPVWEERGFTNLDDLRSALAGDLDWVLLTALRKQPERRYATVREFAEDLQRHLDQRPVLARPESRLYRARRFVQRHRGLVALASALVLVLAIGLVVALLLYADSSTERRRSERTAYTSALTAVSAGIETGDVGAARALLESQPLALRGWEWRHLMSRLDRSLAVFPTQPSLDAQHQFVAYGRDGWMAVPSDTAGFRWVNFHDESRGSSLASGLDGQIRTAVRASPNGEELAAGCVDGSIQFFELGSIEANRVLSVSEARIESVAYHPEGGIFAWADNEGIVGVIDLATVEEPLRFQAHDAGPCRLRFSPDGKRLASASWDESAKIWDTATWSLERTLAGHERWVTDIAWLSDSHSVVTTSLDETIRVWPGTGEPRVFLPHSGAGSALEVLPGDEEVISVGYGGEVLRWRLDTGEVVARFIGHSRGVGALDVDFESGYLVTAAPDGTRVWELDAQDVLTRPASEYTQCLAIDSAGELVANGGPDGVVRIWRMDGTPVEEIRLPPSNTTEIGHDFELV